MWVTEHNIDMTADAGSDPGDSGPTSTDGPSGTVTSSGSRSKDRFPREAASR
jgi:hypothetical protein